MNVVRWLRPHLPEASDGARISRVNPVAPIVRTAGIGGLAMLITYVAGYFLYP